MKLLALLLVVFALTAESCRPLKELSEGVWLRCRSSITGMIDTLSLPAGAWVSIDNYLNETKYGAFDAPKLYRGVCESIPKRPGAMPDKPIPTEQHIVVVDTIRSSVTIVDTTLIASRNEKLELTGVLITLLFVGSGFLIWLWRATK
jgi:hypothetical protein